MVLSAKQLAVNVCQQQLEVSLAGQIELVCWDGGKQPFKSLQICGLAIDLGSRVILELRIVLVKTRLRPVRGRVMKVNLVKVFIGQLAQLGGSSDFSWFMRAA